MGKPEYRSRFADDKYGLGWNDCVDAFEAWEKERPARWFQCRLAWESFRYVCSNCGHTNCDLIYPQPPTCPGCGRKMEE